MERGSGSPDEQEAQQAQKGPRPVTVHDRRRVHVHEDASSEGAEPAGGTEPAHAEAAETAEQPEERIRRLQEEAAGYLDDLQRLKAEFDNYRKRIIKEQTDLVGRATAVLVGRLLTVLDNFELAVAAAEQSRDFDRMLRGVEMVYGELKEVLATEGLEAIEARGKPFDPTVHEAALEVPGDEEGALVVAEVLRPGYTMKGRVVRPAMVKVTRRARAEAGDGDEPPAEG